MSISVVAKRLYDAAYYLAHREARCEYQRAHLIDHREEKRARDAAYHAAHRDEGRERSRAYYVDHQEEKRLYDAAYRADHPEKERERKRRRREAPFTWARLDPWPSFCHLCGLFIDPARVFPDRGMGTLGHEPPVAWMLRHPEYGGTLVLRPEHWACNAAKSDRPDWELVA